MHSIYKFIKNGGGRSTPKKIDAVETLSEVWEYYDSKSSRYTETNVYYQTNPVSHKVVTKAKKTDVLNCVSLFVDIDGFKNKDDIKRIEVDMVAFFERAGIESFITINSGNGLHAIINIGKQQADYIERSKDSIIKILYSPISSIAKEYDGAHVDHKVLESARILRVPFTINKKDGKDEQKCSIITNNWDDSDENDNLVNLISSGVEEPKLNLMFDEIISAFEDIGARWKHSSQYSFLQHPIRGNFDNLCFYQDSRFFYNFSDNDEKKVYSFEEVWNMYGSGKPYPFVVGKADDTEVILEFLKKRYDIRYADQTKAKVVYSVGGHSSYMNETNYKNALKDGFADYLEILKMSREGSKMAAIRFKKVMDYLPQKNYLSEPIPEELETAKSNLATMWTTRFEYFDDESKKNVKSSLTELINVQNFDVLKDKGIKFDEEKICLTYSSLCNMFGDPKRYGNSHMEFTKILHWCGVEVSDNGGAVCFYNDKGRIKLGSSNTKPIAH